MGNNREGDLYKVITVDGVSFEIYYGFYGDVEREHWEPMPVFPNFKKNAVYNGDGFAFATADQDVCEHFVPKKSVSNEGWCHDCNYFHLKEEFIGVCKCPQNKEKKEKLK